MFKALFALLVGALATFSVAADSVMTWSEFDDDRQGLDVFLRYETSGGGIVEKQITHGGEHISPALQLDGSIIWLAWVDRAETDRYTLRYAVLLANSLTLIETGKLATQEARIYAPAISVSPEGTPWLAWAGFDGEDEEIRLAHYENGRWTEQRVLTDNSVPDSQPRFSIRADGGLQLNWEQTTAMAVVERKALIKPVENYSLSLRAPSRAMIRYRKRMAQQYGFDLFEGVPVELKEHRRRVLTGSRVEIQQ